MANDMDIWTGDWRSKLKTQNKQLANMTDQEKKTWDAQRAIGEQIYKKYHTGPYIAFELSDANVFWANTYILRERAAARSKALQASAAAASKQAAAQASGAASAAARSQMTADQQKRASESAAQAAAAKAQAAQVAQAKEAAAGAQRASMLLDQSQRAGESAARAAAAQAEYKKQQEAERAQMLKEQSQRAGESAARAAAAQAEYNKKQQAAQAEFEAQQAAEKQKINDYYYTDTKNYYSSGSSGSSGAGFDDMTTNKDVILEPVNVQGTNLRNSLLIVGGVAFVWWLWKKNKKKKGRK